MESPERFYGGANAPAPPLGSAPWPAAARGRPRVTVGNRADGGVLFWVLRLYGFTALVLLALAVVAAFFTFRYFSATVPPTPDLGRYAQAAKAVSRMYAADDTLLGEFATEWREIVPFESIPKPLVDAFLAVEDHDFFSHGGIYYRGILRALWANITAGDFAQGGSTITQQVAKQFLGAEKSLARKGKEAVMARRLEARYSKRAILSTYLNHIYLGAGAWGVAAAAQRYFQKRLDQLTLAEAATIAGLAKAPSAFSPLARPDLARERRDVVLEKMRTYGFASADDVDAAKAEPITVRPYQDIFPERSPYYAEHVRRYIVETYGADALFGEGLRIETAVEPSLDAAAYENVDFGTRHQDKRQGWRGPEWYVDGDARTLLLQRQRALYGDGPLAPGKRYLAVVDKVRGEGLEVLVGERRLQLPLRNMKWAAKWEPGNADNDQEITSTNKVVKPGDVIWVKREIRTRAPFRDWHMPDLHNPSWRSSTHDEAWDAAHPDVVELEQVPHPQGALFTGDHRSGYVVAMVGGYDYDRSVFNRAVQACRQPGSTYKPIYYALALDQGYGFDTILKDIPVSIVDPDTGETWTPTNLEDTLDGDVTLEYALVFSKNIPSIDIFKRLGAKNVEAWARRLGFTTKIFADDALALGASCTRIDELTRAFSLFARGGRWYPRPERERDWIYVRRILDRSGNILEDATLPSDPYLDMAARLDRVAALGGVPEEQAISARTAFLISKLLAQMVNHGFTSVLRQTKLHAAGKTGTSSDTHDNSFVAFTSRFTTTAWMGDDKKQRALGRKDAAYMTVVPLWSRYMYEATRAFPNPEIPWSVPPGVNPKDRGDHSKGEQAEPMDLIFKSHKQPLDNKPPV
ncbi:MAG: transglycosylase domain-containing protein [Kofleriaceae bacterium]